MVVLWLEVEEGTHTGKWVVVDRLVTVGGRVFVVVTSPYVPDVMADAHGAGHEGIQMMLHRIQANFFIPSARSIVPLDVLSAVSAGAVALQGIVIPSIMRWCSRRATRYGCGCSTVRWLPWTSAAGASSGRRSMGLFMSWNDYAEWRTSWSCRPACAFMMCSTLGSSNHTGA
jgi:hypothetical protein